MIPERGKAGFKVVLSLAPAGQRPICRLKEEESRIARMKTHCPARDVKSRLSCVRPSRWGIPGMRKRLRQIRRHFTWMKLEVYSKVGTLAGASLPVQRVHL